MRKKRKITTESTPRRSPISSEISAPRFSEIRNGFRIETREIQNQRLSRQGGNEGNRHFESRNVLLEETKVAVPYFDKSFSGYKGW